MKTISIASRITTEQTITFKAILPFVITRQGVPFWLEYNSADSPSEDDLEHQPEIPAVQTLNSYRQLPDIMCSWIDGELVIKEAVCERIPGGVVAIYNLPFGGCLWTMLPEDVAK